LNKNLIILLLAFLIVPCLYAQDTLFEVKDSDNLTIFSVTSTGITINGMKFETVAEDNKLELYDAEGKKLFYASPENARFIFHPPAVPPGPSDADRGGFAISTVASSDPTDEDGVNYIDLTPDNTFIGEDAGISNTEGVNNVFIGYQSGMENIGEGGLYKGDNNVFIGYQSGMNNNMSNESGQSNVFIGKWSGTYNDTGRWNVFIGTETGNRNETGYFNTYVGAQAGKGNIYQDGIKNTFIGYMSGHNDNGSENTYLGNHSGYEHLSGDYNTMIGGDAGYKNEDGANNTILGYRAGYNNINGNSNVLLGYMAGEDETGSDKLYIENSDSTTPLIYGDFDTDEVTINGDLEADNLTADTVDATTITASTATITNQATVGSLTTSGTVTADNLAASTATITNQATVGSLTTSGTITANTVNAGIVNARLKIIPSSFAPQNPVEGQLWYSSYTHKLYVYNGSGWQACF